MVVGPAGDRAGSPARISSSARAWALAMTWRGVGLEVGPERLAEADRLAGDDVHQRAALEAGEDGRVELLGPVLRCTWTIPPRGPAQGLVRGRGDEVGHRDRVGVQAGGDQAGDVGHVDEEDRADLAGDLGDPVEVDRPRVGAGAGQDQLRLVLAGQLGEPVVVDPLGLRVERRSRRRDTSGPRSSASSRGSGGRPGPGPSPGRCRRSPGTA